MGPASRSVATQSALVVAFCFGFFCVPLRPASCFVRHQLNPTTRDGPPATYNSERVKFGPFNLRTELSHRPLLAHNFKNSVKLFTQSYVKKDLPSQPAGFRCKVPAFTVVWNVVSHHCLDYGLDVDAALKQYGIVYNPFPYEGWFGPQVHLVGGNLGLFPEILKNGTFVNGGLPQLGNITAHLEKATRLLPVLLPDVNFSGLGVIDWESWRPMWERNFDSLKRYQTASEDYVRHRHPTWTPSEVTAEARRQYEAGARLFLEETLKLVTRMRPRGKWGFYLFPNCYNHEGQRHCDHSQQRLNNRLLWLFNASTATYPSIYLDSSHNASYHRDFIHGQIGEAKRVQAKVAPNPLPVYLYSRVLYRKTTQFYSKEDVVTGLNAACDRGMAGLVMWDDQLTSNSEARCKLLMQHIHGIIGPAVNDLK